MREAESSERRSEEHKQHALGISTNPAVHINRIEPSAFAASETLSIACAEHRQYYLLRHRFSRRREVRGVFEHSSFSIIC